MCLAIPGKVEEIATEDGLRVGVVNFGGVRKKICLDYVPDLAVGDYTIVHVGFALSKIGEMGALEAELGSEEEAFARAAAARPSACPDGSCENK